jgi:hypothetical protein
VEIQGVDMLPLICGLYCVGFINPTSISSVRRQRVPLFDPTE